MDKLRFKLTIAYDGTAYQGWQVQKVGTGVQEKIEQACGRLFPGVKRIHSSSRTDTGVHALGMVAHVDIPRAELKMPDARLALALNAFLPDDIRVLAAVRAPADFHARFDATGKQYRYYVWNHHAMNPLLYQRAWHFPVKLDPALMRAATRTFLGRHDFKSFAGTREYEMKSNVRTLSRCDIRKSGPLYTFTIEGDGFLYKMCRGIVGTLVQVGQGKIPLAEVATILTSRDRRVAGMTAPAHGLVLQEVYYKNKKRRP
jgi:tRNA pseudouridine38-40 synthase